MRPLEKRIDADKAAFGNTHVHKLSESEFETLKLLSQTQIERENYYTPLALYTEGDNYFIHLNGYMGLNFSFRGVVYKGSDLNYIHVGMLARKLGYKDLEIKTMVAGFNGGEAAIELGKLNGRGFHHQTRQITTGTKFALEGAAWWDTWGLDPFTND